MTNIPSLKKLQSLPMGINEYTEKAAAAKATLHSSGRAFLKHVANELGLAAGDYDIRSNKGGIAVSGEVTLHAEHLYVQLSESFVGNDKVTVMYRTCKDRKDYGGGTNNWTSVDKLADGAYAGFVARCQTLMQPAPAAPRPVMPKP